jgi:putative membrane protein
VGPFARLSGLRFGSEEANVPEAEEPDEDEATPEPAFEPDARFSFANERTFLAWNRTALALLVAGLAITQLLPPFPGIAHARKIVGVPLIVLGGVLAVASFLRWEANERALREHRPLPRSMLPLALAALIGLVTLIAVVFVLLARGSGH